jgi:hypothetical protein
MSTEYNVSELHVLHLDASNDRNGNPRRVYVLSHPLDGFLAVTDEGYSGTGALSDLAVQFRGDKLAIVSALKQRVSDRIPTTAAYIRRLLSNDVKRGMSDRSVVISLDAK